MAIAVPDREDVLLLPKRAGRRSLLRPRGRRAASRRSSGELPYRPGDYVVIPRGTTYMFHPDAGVQRYLVIEIARPRSRARSATATNTASSWSTRRTRSATSGGPSELETFTRPGKFEVRIKARDQITAYEFDYHPLDVDRLGRIPLSLDIFNIEDFEPITGRVHMPPPTHQIFEGDGTSSSAPSCRGCTTTTRSRSRCRTTTQRRLRRGALLREREFHEPRAASRSDRSRSTRRASRTGRTPAPSRRRSAPRKRRSWR